MDDPELKKLREGHDVQLRAQLFPLLPRNLLD